MTMKKSTMKQPQKDKVPEKEMVGLFLPNGGHADRKLHVVLSRYEVDARNGASPPTIMNSDSDCACE